MKDEVLEDFLKDLEKVMDRVQAGGTVVGSMHLISRGIATLKTKKEFKGYPSHIISKPEAKDFFFRLDVSLGLQSLKKAAEEFQKFLETQPEPRRRGHDQFIWPVPKDLALATSTEQVGGPRTESDSTVSTGGAGGPVAGPLPLPAEGADAKVPAPVLDTLPLPAGGAGTEPSTPSEETPAGGAGALVSMSTEETRRISCVQNFKAFATSYCCEELQNVWHFRKTLTGHQEVRILETLCDQYLAGDRTPYLRAQICESFKSMDLSGRRGKRISKKLIEEFDTCFPPLTTEEKETRLDFVFKLLEIFEGDRPYNGQAAADKFYNYLKQYVDKSLEEKSRLSFLFSRAHSKKETELKKLEQKIARQYADLLAASGVKIENFENYFPVSQRLSCETTPEK